MPVTYPFGDLARRPVPVAELCAATAALLLVVAGAVDLLPPLAAVALAAAGASVLGIARLLRLVPTSLPRGRLPGAVILFDLGVFAAGLTVAMLPLSAPTSRPALAATGLAVSVALHTGGLVLLPARASAGATAHLRRWADGAGLTASLVFAAWVLLPADGVPLTARCAALVAALGLAVVVLILLRGSPARPGVRLCACGVLTGAVGLTALTLLLAYQVAGWPLLLTAGPLAAGALLVAAGARRAAQPVRTVPPPPHPTTDLPVGPAGTPATGLASGPSAGPAGTPATGLASGPSAGPAGTSATDPSAGLTAAPAGAASAAGPAAGLWLTAPAAVAMLAAALHVHLHGEFDRVGALLGLAVVPPLLLREFLVVAENRRQAGRRAEREARFRALVAGAHDLIFLLDATRVVRWQSPAAERLFGLTEAEVTGRPFGELLHPEDAPGVDAGLTAVLAGARPGLLVARMRDGQGVWRDTESTVVDQRSVPEVGALVVYVRDVGERRRLERSLDELAQTDQLTGLANRRELMRVLAQRQVDHSTSGALLVLDLHELAEINEEHGRAAGDAVLVEVGRRLCGVVAESDLVARLAGDEFAVATEEGAVPAYAAGTRMLGVLTEPYRICGALLSLQVSIGLAELGAQSSAEEALRQADLACHRARQLGRNRIEWYDAYLEERLARRLDLERLLPGAVARNELDLVFQPVIELETALPVGAEALLRWRTPLLGTVLPQEFLPVAEDLGLVGELGHWVLHRACRQLAAWSPGGGPFWMSVNVTPQELGAPDFVTTVGLALAEHGLTGEQIVVEVSEPRVGADPEAVTARLVALRALGVRIALDDFSAAHGSLAQLRRLPIDLLKVEPPAARGEAGGEQLSPLIEVVAGLGQRLGLTVVAEGLESAAQVEQARRAGCRYGQGFALSRPATAERVEAYLEEFPSPSPGSADGLIG